MWLMSECSFRSLVVAVENPAELKLGDNRVCWDGWKTTGLICSQRGQMQPVQHRLRLCCLKGVYVLAAETDLTSQVVCSTST